MKLKPWHSVHLQEKVGISSSESQSNDFIVILGLEAFLCKNRMSPKKNVMQRIMSQVSAVGISTGYGLDGQ
jgi:hypothetical protein